MNDRARLKVSDYLSNPWLTGMIGLAAGFLACWLTMVQPLLGHLNNREEALHEWERINRQEREAIGAIKTIETQELRKWVATLDEQNTRFAELQSLLHRQELELVGPAITHLGIALLAVLGVLAFVGWMMRDSNADAARTLHNAITILPSLRDAMQSRISNQPPPLPALPPANDFLPTSPAENQDS